MFSPLSLRLKSTTDAVAAMHSIALLAPIMAGEELKYSRQCRFHKALIHSPNRSVYGVVADTTARISWPLLLLTLYAESECNAIQTRKRLVIWRTPGADRSLSQRLNLLGCGCEAICVGIENSQFSQCVRRICLSSINHAAIKTLICTSTSSAPHLRRLSSLAFGNQALRYEESLAGVEKWPPRKVSQKIRRP
jgi:hypothetical protein